MNPQHNSENIETLLGKHILIDVTVRAHDETLLERRQAHGDVIRVSPNEGVVVKLSDVDNEMALPPDMDRFEPLEPGRYPLGTEGAAAENPDFRIDLTVHMPPPEFEGRVKGGG